MLRHLPAPAALLVAAALAGCGGSGDASGEPAPAVTVDAAKPLEVIADEYSFDPEAVVARADGGEARLEIVLRNEGSIAHNLKLFRDGTEIGGTPTFQGGQTRSGTVTLTPGRYEMICTVGDHADLGMTGTLEVR